MEIHVAREGRKLGQFTAAQAREEMASGRLLPTDLAWHEGLDDWAPLASLRVVQESMMAQPAPPSALQVRPITQSIQQKLPAQPAASAPAPEEKQPAATPAAKAQANRVNTSPLARWSLRLGLASLVLSVLTAIPAIFCGHRALAQIGKSKGKLGGRGMALTGLLTAYLALALLPLAWHLASRAFEGNKRAESIAATEEQVRQVLAACETYARANDGHFPPDLELLTEQRLLDPAVVRDPELGVLGDSNFTYFGRGMTLGDPADKVIVISNKIGPDGQRAVGHLGGSISRAALETIPHGK